MRGGFLRYLHLEGFISTPMADCVPSVRRWRLAGLPTFLPPEKVQKVLDACDRTTAMGHRDYAVLMILAKLGLRVSEVATLTRNDIAFVMPNLPFGTMSQNSSDLGIPSRVSVIARWYDADHAAWPCPPDRRAGRN
ncbi:MULTISPECIES: tyrosine-type recombinase/integrase [unclassified Sinorhizobium]|uniref:tyrosine-type recombinase/integrase n=1 Tax=unclassified Sinorhizobium TaxID=2613772 RepID=UPI0024C36783|nr:MULTISPECIES: tyrosine-type recombinase/integrase [unclassified Sinorhizobium]MDK1378624.1 tyrosine-type recombinase/integrase [Sinorhizobium sp. 6-70]MDK1482407.1 tyrosine-type recombinase/integrase [Sinorhizobium sp. 6-117]